MTVPAVHCEARKAAYRQTKDGLVVSFVIHPSDMPDALAVAPLGTRYMLALAQISDDEQLIPPAGSLNPSDRKDHPEAAPSVERAGHLSTKAQPPAGGNSAKERRPWHTLPPQTRAGMLCSDAGFQKWVSRQAGWTCDEQDSRDWLCMRLGIQSRAELATDPEAAERFDAIDRQFMLEAGRAVEVR